MFSETTFKVSTYTLEDRYQFNGENYAKFCEAFKFLLEDQNLLYLIEEDSQGQAKDGPTGHDRISDNTKLFRSLRLNVNDKAYNVLEIHASSKDGVAAWKTFRSHYALRYNGSPMGLFTAKRNLVWDGIDEESFDTFMTQFIDLHARLKAAGFSFSDPEMALDLLQSVPVEFLPPACSIVFNGPSKLTLDTVTDLIKSIVHLHQCKTYAGGHVAKLNPKKINNHQNEDRNDDRQRPKIKTPCSTCKLLGVEDEKAMHRQSSCWNEKRFPAAIKKLRELRNRNVNLVDDMANLMVSSNNKEEEAPFMLTKTVGALTKTDWIITTGCTASMTPNIDVLDNYIAINGQNVTVANQEKMLVSGRGQIAFKGEDGKAYRLMNVLHVPGLAHNLFAILPFTGKGAMFEAFNGVGILSAPGGTTIVTGHRKPDRLLHCSIYPTTGVSPSSASVSCLLTQAALHHRRLGYVSTVKMQGIPSRRDDRCEARVAGKFKRLPIHQTEARNYHPIRKSQH